jgi:hypothetical protein
MDPFPIEGLDQGQVEAAAQGAFSAIAAALSGDAFASGPARMESDWGRTSLVRPAWRADIDAGLARKIRPVGKGTAVTLSNFTRTRTRQTPRIMETKGRFWELSISCAEAKVEFAP